MPVYNEQESVPKVIKEWTEVLGKLVPGYTFLGINDGSKDKTLEILHLEASKNLGFRVLDKPNSGHGQSCITGYQYALDHGAEWVFQMDSDGQCSPLYFESILKASPGNKVIYGFRKTRDDGWRRYLISRLVSMFAYTATGVWIRDANVPYRLMHRSTLEKILPFIPKDFHLANILLAVLQKKFFGIKWVNIHFLNRTGGTASVKAYSFAKHGIRLFIQLRNARTRAFRLS